MAGVEFLIFEGVSSDLRPWISALEDQFALDDYSDLNKLALAVYLIGGKAEWFVQKRHEFKYFETWDDLKSSLILKFGERDDSERIRLEAERDKLVLNGRDNETIKNTDVMEHIVNLEPNEMHQEESELNTTKTKVDQEFEVVCSIQDKLSLEGINSLLETDGVHPREAIPKSQVLVSSTESDHGDSMDRITVNQIDLVKNVECSDVAWLFNSRNIMDSVMVGDEFSKSLLDMEIIGNAHQMYDRMSLRAKSRKQLKCWKFKFKRKKLTGTRQKFEQHKLVISVTSLGQNEKRFSDLADRLQKRNTVSDRCSGVQNIRGAVLWFKYKQEYSMRKLSLMMKCSKKKEKFAVIQRLKQIREDLMFALQEVEQRYDTARSASVRYGAIQDVESTFSQLEGTYDEHMMLTENVGPHNSDEVVSCWISVPVTSINQKEPERLIGYAETVDMRAVGQDQDVYADLSSDNMTLAPDYNLQKNWILQALASNLRLGYSMCVFSSNQSVVHWFPIVQNFDVSVLEKEQQVMYTIVNKPWDPSGTAVARCLRVLWRHQEQWFWPRLHIKDSYAIEMETYSERESDCVVDTSKATDSVEDTCVFPKPDSQSTQEAGSVIMSKEGCSATILILEEFTKTEHSLQEDFSNEKTREIFFKDLCFSQEKRITSAIVMRGEIAFSGKSWETLKLMKQLGKRLLFYKNLIFKYKETRKVQGGSVCVADVEEFVLLKLYKSWRFKFRYISWVI